VPGQQVLHCGSGPAIGHILKAYTGEALEEHGAYVRHAADACDPI